jgi:hypothetical protein
MNNLENLIMEYEKENPGKKARKSGKWAFTLDFTIWQANEIEKLASRPTCGEEYMFEDVSDWEKTTNVTADESFKLGFVTGRATFSAIKSN